MFNETAANPRILVINRLDAGGFKLRASSRRPRLTGENFKSSVQNEFPNMDVDLARDVNEAREKLGARNEYAAVLLEDFGFDDQSGQAFLAELRSGKFGDVNSRATLAYSSYVTGANGVDYGDLVRSHGGIVTSGDYEDQARLFDSVRAALTQRGFELAPARAVPVRSGGYSIR